MTESVSMIAVPGDYNWLISSETFEPIYNWHLPQDHPGRPEVPQHVLDYALELKAKESSG